IADGSYRTLLKERFAARVAAGPIEDEQGRVIGDHDGVALYTVGQRSGLRLRTHGPAEEPRYVTALRPETNTVQVGTAADLLRTDCEVEDVRWVSGHSPAGPFRPGVKVRSHAPAAAAALPPVARRARRVVRDPRARLAPGRA